MPTKIRRHFSGLGVQLTFLGWAFVALIFIGYAGALVETRKDVWDRAQRKIGNIAELLQQDIARNLSLYSLSLQGVIEGVGDPDVMASSPKLRNLILFDRSASAEFLGSILVLDVNGDIIADSSYVYPRIGNFSDREYFQAQRKNADLGLYISQPFESRLSSGTTIAFSRRIEDRHHNFAGVAVGTMKLAYFQQAIRRINLGKQGIVGILRDDGSLIAASSTHVTLRPSTSADGEFYEAQSVDDTLFIGARKLAEFPLSVQVGLSEKEMFATWFRNAKLGGMAAIGLSLGILWLTGHLRAQVSRRAAVEKQLAELALTDPLTGLKNRRALEQELDRIVKSAARRHQPCSALMIDVDHFKGYNDLYGHQAGDHALKAVAFCINSGALRADDLAVRYGGEEFAIVLPDTDLAGALVVAEKVRASVQALGMLHQGNEIGTLSVSIGAAGRLIDAHFNGMTLFELADCALYEAKSRGRNCVVQASDGLTLVRPTVSIAA